MSKKNWIINFVISKLRIFFTQIVMVIKRCEIDAVTIWVILKMFLLLSSHDYDYVSLEYIVYIKWNKKGKWQEKYIFHIQIHLGIHKLLTLYLHLLLPHHNSTLLNAIIFYEFKHSIAIVCFPSISTAFHSIVNYLKGKFSRMMSNKVKGKEEKTIQMPSTS